MQQHKCSVRISGSKLMPSVGRYVCHFDVKIKEFCNVHDVHLGDKEIIQYP